MELLPANLSTHRIPCVVTSIDTTAKTMKVRRVRYEKSPPVPGAYKLIGDEVAAFPMELATIYDYRVSRVVAAHAQYRNGTLFVEPNDRKSKTTKLFAVFQTQRFYGFLAELEPTTMKPVTGRITQTPFVSPAGCGVGSDYLWTADVSRQEVYEYSTVTMMLLRKFSTQPTEKKIPAIDGVNLHITAIGGKDNLIYLFGQANDGDIRRRLVVIVDVVGEQRDLVVRETLEMRDDLGLIRPSTINGGGGDDKRIFIAADEKLYTLNGTNHTVVAEVTEHSGTNGMGGNINHCLTTHLDVQKPTVA